MQNKDIAKAFSTILLAILLLSVFPAISSAASSAKSTDPMANPFTGVVVAELKGAPLADYVPALPKGGGEINENSQTSQNYLNQENSQQTQLLNFIQSNNLNAQIVYRFSVLLNGFALKLNNVVPNTLLKSGVVSSVYAASRTYQPDMDVSPSVVGLSTLDLTTDLGLWADLGGHQNAGLGMKIGIIDTGIDINNPFLKDPTLPAIAGFPKCDALDSSTNTANQDCINVSNKVIVAKVFQSAYGTSFTAFAAQDHGSHVSGIAAGVFNTTTPFSTHPLSGIAPKAYLGNYNVFPGTSPMPSTSTSSQPLKQHFKTEWTS